ncbi:hypothetical protein HZC53_01325 [Candidatus Uhrbacteria bacterium]|nr:hypothetical protein [Candidatus Uhrbacteria bacterium]
MKFELARNPFNQQETIERERRLKRTRVIAALLSATTIPSIEACASPVALGRGPLVGIESADRPTDLPDLPTYGEMTEQLKAAIGEDTLGQAMAMHQAYARHAEEPPLETHISGFENMDMKDSHVTEYLGTFPRSWISNLSSVSLNSRFLAMPYPGLEGHEQFGHGEYSYGGETFGIEFTHSSLKRQDNPSFLDVQSLLYAVSHELAHGSDWRSAHGLDNRRALTLLWLSHRAATEEGRPKFDYPESIKAKTPDKKCDETFARTTEFYAELMSTALNLKGCDRDDWVNSVELRLIHGFQSSNDAAERNRRMVELVLKWTAPDFRPWDAANQRAELEQKIVSHHFLKRLERGIGHIEDKQLSAAFMGVLDSGSRFDLDDVNFQARRIGMVPPDQNAYPDTKSLIDELGETGMNTDDETWALVYSILRETLDTRSYSLNLTSRHGIRIRPRMKDPIATIDEFNQVWRKLTEEQRNGLRPELLKFISQGLAKAPLKENRVARGE